MLAKHRLHHYLRIVDQFRRRFVVCAAVIAVDPQPMHLAVPIDLILSDDRNVVLALTRQHACGAADARIEIDRHSPLMDVALEFERLQVDAVLLAALLVGPIRMLVDHQRQTGLGVLRDVTRMAFQIHVLGKFRFFLELFQVGFADDWPAFHRPVLLCA